MKLKLAPGRPSLMADRALLVALWCYVVRVLFFIRLYFYFPSKLGLLTLGDASDQHCISLLSITCIAPCNTNSFYFRLYVSSVHNTASHYALHGSFCPGGLLVIK
jgi:hypothetical protein